MIESDHPKSRLFGRRKGRPLHTRKRMLVETLLSKFRLVLQEQGKVWPETFFGKSKNSPTWLEIGFGGGEHLAAQAKNHPEVFFIGCEPFLNGVAGLLDAVEREKLENIRIFDNDARLVLDALEEASIERCFVLFADPWPKKRHAERRFIGPENLERLARVLKPCGLLRLASDHPSLIEWMRGCLADHPDFVCVHEGTNPPADWIPTRYQQKALLAGRTPFFMDYRRKQG